MIQATKGRFGSAGRAGRGIGLGLLLAAFLASSTPARAQSAPAGAAQGAPSSPAGTAAPAAGQGGAPAEAKEASTPPEASHASSTLSYALLGTGAASLVVGAVFGILALSDKSKFDSNPTFDQSDSVRDKTLVADVCLGLGVVLGGAGTAFLLLDHSSSGSGKTQAQSQVAQVRVGPMVGPSRGGATLTVSFQ